MLNKVVGLQAEKISNNVFGGGGNVFWYWYTGDVTIDGFADTIVMDMDKAEREITRWKNKFQ